MSLNIFQIWDSIGRKTPFAVRKSNWSKTTYVIIEHIDCPELPYGKAYGYATKSGKYADFYKSDRKWKESKIIPNSGVYDWVLVDVKFNLKKDAMMDPIKAEQQNGFNTQLYKQRVGYDSRMINKEALLEVGRNLFKTVILNEVIQPFDFTKKLDLSEAFWDFTIANGLQSVKKGFYKICQEPALRDIAGVKTWSSYVLYHNGNEDGQFYLYYANIGTIVNRYAICGDLSKGKFVTLPTVVQKEAFLKSLLNRPFYVTRAENVTDNSYGLMKEVLWFVWD